MKSLREDRRGQFSSYVFLFCIKYICIYTIIAQIFLTEILIYLYFQVKIFPAKMERIERVIPRQIDKKSRGPQGEKGLEFSRRKKGQTFFSLYIP